MVIHREIYQKLGSEIKKGLHSIEIKYQRLNLLYLFC